MEGRIGTLKIRAKVGIHDTTPVGKVRLGQRPEVGDARVVNQNVEAAEGLFDLCDGLRDLLWD